MPRPRRVTQSTRTSQVTLEGANDVIIAMSTAEYINRDNAGDDALRDAANQQPPNKKCNRCQGMKHKVLLCSYSVDPNAPPMRTRGSCNHCAKLRRTCGSRTLPYARAESLHLPPIAYPASNSDSSYIEIDDESTESIASESSARPSSRSRPQRQHRRLPERFRGNDGTGRLATESHKSYATSSISSIRHASTLSISQFPLPVHEEFSQKLQNITANVRNLDDAIQNIIANVRYLEDMMRPYPAGGV